MPLCCVECKPCNGHCLPGPPGGLFKSRRPAQLLRRALGKMKVGGTRRRPRRPGSFSSVRAVFWPLMSMRSEADARPPTDSPDDTVSSGALAPPPSVQDDGGRAASTTVERVLALQARVGGEAPRSPPPPQQLTTAVASKVSVAEACDEAKAIVVRQGDVGGDVEAACRSFERHLMEKLVEERKVMDLTDVEELLCCWEQLTCPAFVRLVGRFYGELCTDLFSSAQDADDVWSSHQSEDLSV
ncbi:transcription repressor OFP7-like [Miscanthus floridulus]|uniref:transcription repressor OFP7-like n=1 Tax=Miscanthus floridulus TaxID=154761 RepID=UPI00345B2B68